jgi:predicted dehydrogenase
MNPTRIAVIGVGAIGRKHADLLRAEPRCELVAVADPAPDAKEYAGRLGVPYFADAREMLDQAKPEGVVIASPTPLHAPMDIACAERGVHMLMEKPIAESVEASLALPKLELWQYQGERGWNAPLQCERIAVEPADPLVRQLRHLSSVIRGEETPRITGADATRTLCAVLAVKRAAETGTVVSVY